MPEKVPDFPCAVAEAVKTGARAQTRQLQVSACAELHARARLHALTACSDGGDDDDAPIPTGHASGLGRALQKSCTLVHSAAVASALVGVERWQKRNIYHACIF